MSMAHIVADLLLTGMWVSISSAASDLLWDNGEWDGAKAISSERNTQVTESWLVDDFVIQSEVMIRDLEWLALRSVDARPTGVDLIVLDAGFAPIVERFDLAFDDQFEGMGFGHEVHRLTLSNLDLPLQAGRYYIGARYVGDGAGRAFAAGQFNLHGATEAYFRSDYFGYPDWVPTYELGITPSDAVFKVYGDIIPAPPALAVVLPGFLVFRRRR